MSGKGASLLPGTGGSLLLLRLRSIGDAVLTLPLAEAIRRERPDLRLSLLLEPAAAALLSGQPLYDEVIVVARSLRARLRVLTRIRRRRFDLALDLHGGPTAALLTRLSGAGLRLGVVGYRHPRAYHHLLPKAGPGPVPTVLTNLALARSLGLDPSPHLAPRLALEPAAVAEVEAVLEAAGIAPGAPFLVVHPWAAMASKTWPLARFEELVRRLAALGHVVVVPRREGRGPELAGASAVGPLGLPALAALLARARLFVGNDSGPAHMAAAVGTAVIAIFGSQDPRVWRAWPDGGAIWKGLACSPCPGYRCSNPQPFECLESITVEEVEQAVRARLG